MAKNMDEMDHQDSLTTKISALLPKTGQPFRFVYQYDFGNTSLMAILR